MKRLPFLLILFLLVPLLVYSAGGATCMMAGGGASGAAACTETTPNSQTTQTDSGNLGTGTDNLWLQSPYVAAGTGTYTVKTLYLKLKTIGTVNPAWTLTAYLCTTNNSTTIVDSCTASINTISTNDLNGTYADKKFTFAGFSQTNGTTYHVAIASSTYQDVSNYVRWGDNNGYASPGCYKDNDGSGTWTALDTTCQYDFVLKNCEE